MLLLGKSMLEIPDENTARGVEEERKSLALLSTITTLITRSRPFMAARQTH